MKNATINLIKNHWFYEAGILNSEKMFTASILIPLCEINEKTYILFEKRAKNIKQGDEICFPGGRYEKNDINFSFTALRETSEELGIPIEKIKILKELDAFVTPFNSIIYSFLGYLEISDFDDINFQKEEVQKVLFIPLDWFLNIEPEKFKVHVESQPHLFDNLGNKISTFPAKDLGLPLIYHNSWSNGYREILSYNYHGEIIWGFTASILKKFIERYRELSSL